MAKRSLAKSKPRSADMARKKGETRPSRNVVSIYESFEDQPDAEVIDPPSGMTPDAQVIWRDKVEMYRQRGMKIGGTLSTLRQYCELEACLIRMWAEGRTNVSMLNTFRMYAIEFYDTPASRHVRAAPPSKSGEGFDKFK